MTCPALGLEDGEITYNDSQVTTGEYPVDTVATFICSYGYSMSGSQSSKCTTTGSWNEETPTCNLGIENHTHVVVISTK